MEAAHGVSFGPDRLARPHGPLRQCSQEGTIPPKALAELWLLVRRAGAVVTKEEFLSTVWEGTVVRDETLTSCLRRPAGGHDGFSRLPGGYRTAR